MEIFLFSLFLSSQDGKKELEFNTHTGSSPPPTIIFRIQRLGFFTDLYATFSNLFSIPFSIISNILLVSLQPTVAMSWHFHWTTHENYQISFWVVIANLELTTECVQLGFLAPSDYFVFVFHKHCYYTTIIYQRYKVSGRISASNANVSEKKILLLLLYAFSVLFLTIFLAGFIRSYHLTC